MLKVIPYDEIYNDLELAKDGCYSESLKRNVRPIDIKQEIGQKYGLDKKQCSKSENIKEAILLYLRDLRKAKTSFSNMDISDFFALTKYASKYNNLQPYLMMETQSFIKFLLDSEYNYILNKFINLKATKYILDNIEKVNLNDSYKYSSSDRFLLERFRSIKKYYDEHYGDKIKNAEETGKTKYSLESKIIEETYEIRLQLEQYLEDFIRDKAYSFDQREHNEIIKLNHETLEKIRQIPLDKKNQFDPELHRLRMYADNLYFLEYAYRYFNTEESEEEKEERINTIVENSIEHFNKSFDTLCMKTIVKALMKRNDLDIDTIKISEVEEMPFGYQFIISYNENKKLYITFALRDEKRNYKDIDNFIHKPSHINFINWNTIDYGMAIYSKPIKNVSESFDFNSMLIY